jgi:hypothetical protein
MLDGDDMTYIAKAVKEFVKTDTKGFAPTIGQIRTIAAEIRKEEWDKRQRENFQLPEPEIERIPMPDDIRQKLEGLFKL